MKSESFALRLCSLLKDLLGLENVFILNYGNHFPSAEVCLLNSILRRPLIRNTQDRSWIQGKGAGVGKRRRRPWWYLRGSFCSTSSPSGLPHSLRCQLPGLLFLSVSLSFPINSPHLHLHCSIKGDGTKHPIFFQPSSWDKQLLLMEFLKLRA